MEQEASTPRETSKVEEPMGLLSRSTSTPDSVMYRNSPDSRATVAIRTDIPEVANNSDLKKPRSSSFAKIGPAR